jgi:hypothetical protein
VAAVNVTEPVPVPVPGLRVNHAAFSLALQFNVPPPVLWIERVCAAGLVPPWMAVKERAVGLAPMAGLIDGGVVEGAGSEDGAISCANPGISSANLLADRPPAPSFLEIEECPVPAAARGAVPVDGLAAAMDLMVVVDGGAMLGVVRGTVAPALLINDDGSLD